MLRLQVAHRARGEAGPGYTTCPILTGCSGAASPASGGRNQQVSHVASSCCAPWPEPSLSRRHSSCVLRGWEPHASERAGRGGWVHPCKPAEPQPCPSPAPAAPTCCAEPSATGFVRFVCLHLSGLPRRSPSRGAHPRSAIPGKGCWLWGCGWKNPSCLAPSRVLFPWRPWNGL